MTLEPGTVTALGRLGGVLALTFSAAGSAFGIAVAGMAAVGAWKKCYAQNRPAPFILAVFVGAPITQTFYGMIVMFKLLKLAAGLAAKGPADAAGFMPLILWGVLGGFVIGLSAYMQGKIAACASDAQAETGQGFTNYLMALGIIESVAIFAMVFILIAA